MIGNKWDVSWDAVNHMDGILKSVINARRLKDENAKLNRNISENPAVGTRVKNIQDFMVEVEKVSKSIEGDLNYIESKIKASKTKLEIILSNTGDSAKK